ncbi:cyclic nucleotide-binding domain-containing protein [Streptomyces sp. SID8376]|uniref:histidine kinase n=2 Tax=Streptomyces TaxID=1883 RepID=A0ABU0KP08_9ACTN|nr:cyclic nucleotide-binding domain-containing protein [Streptomyces sp. McG7]MBT2904469.1 cyclic nucleotide-binding domain-containing protein [Streptomyces sp. McG8]MDQ0490151.1 signal transduction histidine kinase [Streptomyces thermodiastaticus]MXQ60901.1 cyclic nucleotide-binding domain-containing protein [Streptomyces sp. XHT-2]MYQ29669.1 cyclic nucleotide-binding domain-containing protein [Streptomyces sp. SID4956]MYW53045.1 cyclic nucleotide-binding domain-containing protein [Streptomyc
MSAQPMECLPDEIGSLFLFEKLTPEQLGRLCEAGRVERYEPGTVYAEGDPATCFYVMVEGTVVLSRRVGGDDVEVTRTSQRGVYAGAMQAYLGDRVPQVYNNSLRVTEPTRFFVLPADTFADIMRDWFPMAVHLLEGLFFGVKSTQQAVGQRERLLALGSLSAGLTHELNNPAAAAVRATATLRERVGKMRRKLRIISEGAYDRETLAGLIEIQERTAERVAKAPVLSPLEASDREDLLADWLDDHGVEEGWRIAPTFVQAGLDTDWLEQVAAAVDEETLPSAVGWLNYTVETELLMDEIQDSAARISHLVDAAKQYSQLDRAPFQVADVHELLDSTLLMLSGKLGQGIRVVKEYDRTLPRVPAYPAELNQVWTNLVDNAVAAMREADGEGTLTVRTARENDALLVEFGDTGPGIPAEIRDRVFDPFFTTKPVGEGTGLGLDISWRIVVNKHHGSLRFDSEPGDTRFQVLLPLTAPASDHPQEEPV